MSFPRYERYKQSGVQWLGEVPEHWKISRLGFESWVRARLGWKGLKADEYVDNGYVFLATPNIKYRFIDFENVNYINQARFDESPEIKLREGDVLLAKDGSTLGTVNVVRSLPREATVNSSIAVITPHESLLGTYLYYQFQSKFMRDTIESLKGGMGVPHLFQEDLNKFRVLCPPNEEQERIVEFLDRETEKIDSLIAEQRRLIVFLLEKRTAVIAHSVTQGLNRNARMKRSGVTWIGNFPVHWNSVSSRRLFRVRNESARDTDQQLTASQKYGMVFQSDYIEMEGRRVVEVIQGTDSLRHAERNDFIISLRSFQGGLEWCKFPGSVTFHYVVLVPIKEVHEPYFAYLFKSTSYIQALRATANLIRDGQDLRYSHFVLVDLPRVPIEEQVQIASFLDIETARIDTLISEVQVAIEKLQERRSALISAVITGKINVIAKLAKPVRSTWSTGFARQVLAAETLSRCNGSRMGRIKLQKLIHLCEYHAQLDELRSTYSRKAAGPFDAQAMAGVRNGLLQQRWFEEFKDGGRYAYRPLEKAGGHKQYLTHWEDKQARIDQVLNLLGGARTRTCEIASTLYAAWNDLLIEGKNPTDAEIIHEASSAERWHESKEKIAADKWPKALEWMRAKELVPLGYGTHTMHQADLFKGESHEPA